MCHCCRAYLPLMMPVGHYRSGAMVVPCTVSQYAFDAVRDSKGFAEVALPLTNFLAYFPSLLVFSSTHHPSTSVPSRLDGRCNPISALYVYSRFSIRSLLVSMSFTDLDFFYSIAGYAPSSMMELRLLNSVDGLAPTRRKQR